MKRLAVLIIILWYVNLASAATFSPSDIEWASAVSNTLSKGGTMTSGEYMVKAVQFPSPVPGVKDIKGNIIPETDVEPSVFLEVYKKGVLIKELVMNLQTEAYTDPDYEVKISTTGLPAKNAKEWIFEYYNPSATISIQLRAKPKIEVTVTTDKSEYISYNERAITATVKVSNTGEARAKNIDVYLNIGELALRGGDTSQLHQYYNKMEKGESNSFSVILVVPELIDPKSYALSAEAKGFDVKDLEYKTAKSSVSVTVSPKLNFFVISKGVKDRMYLQNTATVTVSVGNGGMFDVYNINVTDKMNENFELKTNTSFQWYIPVLKPGEERSWVYSIKPLEASLSGFTMPAATAQFTLNNKQYSASSNTITVVVNGPKIILNKTVNKQVVNITGDVTVTVSINNIGSIATRAEVKDYLPDGVSLVSGSTNLPSTFLELKTPQGFSYTIRMNKEGNITLPAAVANYTGVEYRGTTRSVLSSERPVITVIDPSNITPTPAETPNQTATPASTPTITATPTQTTPKQQETPSFTQKIINKVKELFKQESTVAPTPTATPEEYVTPGFDTVFAIIALLFIAFRRR